MIVDLIGDKLGGNINGTEAWIDAMDWCHRWGGLWHVNNDTYYYECTTEDKIKSGEEIQRMKIFNFTNVW